MKPQHPQDGQGAGPVRPSGAFRPRVFRRRPFGERRARRPLPRLSGLPLQKLIPNAMTVFALCAGMTSVRFAMHGQWQQAVASILIAAVIDGLDGRVARLLKAQSRFGEELDSLADAVNFGVAPALLLYLWTLDHAGGFGWFAAVALAVCCVLRLARFNAALGGTVEKPLWAFNYFTGVPAPAGAGLALAPMALSFEIGKDWAGDPYFVAVWTLVVAALMISAVPTFSFKRLRVPVWAAVPLLVGVGLTAAALVSQPWWTLSVLAIAYGVTIVLSARQYARLKAAAEQMQATDMPSADAPKDGAAGGDGATPSGV